MMLRWKVSFGLSHRRESLQCQVQAGPHDDPLGAGPVGRADRGPIGLRREHRNVALQQLLPLREQQRKMRRSFRLRKRRAQHALDANARQQARLHQLRDGQLLQQLAVDARGPHHVAGTLPLEAGQHVVQLSAHRSHEAPHRDVALLEFLGEVGDEVAQSRVPRQVASRLYPSSGQREPQRVLIDVLQGREPRLGLLCPLGPQP